QAFTHKLGLDPDSCVVSWVVGVASLEEFAGSSTLEFWATHPVSSSKENASFFTFVLVAYERLCYRPRLPSADDRVGDRCIVRFRYVNSRSPRQDTRWRNCQSHCGTAVFRYVPVHVRACRAS